MRLTLKTLKLGILKLATSLILLSSLITLTACDDILTSQPTHTVNKQYNSNAETYAYDSQLRHYQQERARLERDAHESQLALERAKNAADRTRLEQEARLRMEKAEQIHRQEAKAVLLLQQAQMQVEKEKAAAAQNALHAEKERRQRAEQAQIAADRALAERMQAEEHAAAARQAKEVAERQKALEARNNALQIQRDREAKQRTIDAQIASDRALAERLQREEVEAFQRQQAEIRKPSVNTSQVESMRAPALDPAPVQASPSIVVPTPTAATAVPQSVTVTETSATPKAEAIEAAATVDNGSTPMAQSPTVVAQ